MPSNALATSNNIVDKFRSKQQKTQLAVLAAVGGLTIVFSAQVLALMERLVAIGANTFYLGLELAAAAVIYLFASNKTVQMLVRSMWFAGIRALMMLWVEMNPLNIAENYVRDLIHRISRFDEQLTNLWAQITGLRKRIKTNEREIEAAENRCAYLKTHVENPLTNSEFIVNAQQAHRVRESNDRLNKLRAQLEIAHKILNKLREFADTVKTDTENAVKTARIERDASKEARGAFDSAMSIIRDNSDGKALYDQAMAVLGTDFEERMGAIEQFTLVSEGFLSSIDTDKGVVGEEMLARLESMQTKFLGTMAPDIIDTTATHTSSSKMDRVPSDRSLFSDVDSNNVPHKLR